jgi:hypothetical protein
MPVQVQPNCPAVPVIVTPDIVGVVKNGSAEAPTDVEVATGKTVVPPIAATVVASDAPAVVTSPVRAGNVDVGTVVTAVN